MRVHITGIAGTLGSLMAETLLDKGFEISGNDIVRPAEAWRLDRTIDKIKYSWQSTTDLQHIDADVVVDAGLSVADRDFGINSPYFTAQGNLAPVIRLAEIARRDKFLIIYPSSFNTLYGYNGGVFSEKQMPFPTSAYGWSKAAAELLYLAYSKSFGVRVVITRVGSAFGKRMRPTELISNLILHALNNQNFRLMSPHAHRLWTFSEDVAEFYVKLLENLDEFEGRVLHCAGNAKNEILENLEVARRVKMLSNSDFSITEAEYEHGEIVNGKPIEFTAEESSIGWRPRHTFDEGLKETLDWFSQNKDRYNARF